MLTLEYVFCIIIIPLLTLTLKKNLWTGIWQGAAIFRPLKCIRHLFPWSLLIYLNKWLTSRSLEGKSFFNLVA